jgi:signal transduction histidine kinase
VPLRALWTEPRPSNVPVRVWRDWALVGVVVAAAVLEGLLRADVPWRWVQVVATAGLATTLLWRRTQPLAMVVVGIGGCTVVQVAVNGALSLNTLAALLILPYALFRWGSGREALLGSTVGLAAVLVSAQVHSQRLSDVVGGLVVLVTTMALGMAMRYRTTARQREIEQVRLRERESIARDLHDTVAHHVSAIAVRAQAGLAVAGQDANAAVDSLRVVESEATRALAEMRAMVRVLREGDQVDLAPTPELDQLRDLARQSRLPVEVSVTGDLAAVPTAVGTAIYRLAQESVTNALRHARNATRVWVAVAVSSSAVRLEVSDDGDPAPAVAQTAGYGLAGMAERASLLGGRLQAGPGQTRGWTVIAVLPVSGAVA